MTAEPMAKPSPGPKVSYSIKDIWNPSEEPTYIIDKGEFVTINRATTNEDTVDLLKTQVDLNIQKIEEHGYKVKAIYIGKTYVLGENDDDENAQNPEKWDKSGLSSRWSTSHKEPARNEIGGKRNMIVLTTAITDDNVPENIIKEYEKEQHTTKAKCAAEYYTLHLESKLSDKYMNGESPRLEHTNREGNTSKKKGYVLYMRITYRKRVDPEEKKKEILRDLNWLVDQLRLTTDLETTLDVTEKKLWGMIAKLETTD